MNYVPVSSSNVAAVGYDDTTSTLGVRFHSGHEYHYSGVPRSVFDAFLGASSKGQFLDQQIKKGGYPYRRIS